MTISPLCEFAKSFPVELAAFIESEDALRGRHREETLTSLLMFGLLPFRSLGVRVRFPRSEKKTGADMHWHFVRRHHRPRYFSLLIQAKRAKPTGASNEWFYEHLDYPHSDKGSQAEVLVGREAAHRAALYAFYHPRSACIALSTTNEPVEGVNLVFARLVAEKVKGGCSRREKLVTAWRSDFHDLGSVLCQPSAWFDTVAVRRERQTSFLRFLSTDGGGVSVNPDAVAKRLNEMWRRRIGADVGVDDFAYAAGDEIPADVLRLLDDDAGEIDVAQPTVSYARGAGAAQPHRVGFSRHRRGHGGEDMAGGRRPMAMANWERQVDDYLRLLRRDVLRGGGTISRPRADAIVHRCYERFDIARQDAERLAADAAAERDLQAIEAQAARLAKRASKKPPATKH